jgi:hypothetical protein
MDINIPFERSPFIVVCPLGPGRDYRYLSAISYRTHLVFGASTSALRASQDFAEPMSSMTLAGPFAVKLKIKAHAKVGILILRQTDPGPVANVVAI